MLVKWDLDNKRAMRGRATAGVLALIEELESEGLLWRFVLSDSTTERRPSRCTPQRRHLCFGSRRRIRRRRRWILSRTWSSIRKAGREAFTDALKSRVANCVRPL